MRTMIRSENGSVCFALLQYKIKLILEEKKNCWSRLVLTVEKKSCSKI